MPSEQQIKVEDAAAAPAADVQMADAAAPAAPKAEEAAVEKEVNPEIASKVLKQVEFYFADANLPFDKFLYTLTKKDAEGWVPVATIASFKRMRDFTKEIGVDGVAQALRASPELLEVDAEGKNVRRKTKMEQHTDAHTRSIYAKGFPDEIPTLQAELEAYFNKFGSVNAVRMRRDDKRVFKNSVFVEYAKLEDATAFLALPAEERKYLDKELLTMSKDAYVQMKCKEKGITPGQAKKKGPGAQRTFNAFKEDGGAAAGSSSSSSAPREIKINVAGKSIKVNPDGTFDESEIEFTPGAVLEVKGAGTDGPWVKDLKSAVQAVSQPAFVSINEDKASGKIGFKSAVTDEHIVKLNDLAIELQGRKAVFSRPDEASERAYYIASAQGLAKAALNPQQHNGGGRGGRGGRGGGRGGRGGRGGGRGGFQGGKRKREEGGAPKVESTKKPKTEGEVKAE